MLENLANKYRDHLLTDLCQDASWLRRERLGISDLCDFASHIRHERIVPMRYLKIEREHFCLLRRLLTLFRFHGLFLISTTFYLFLRISLLWVRQQKRKELSCKLQKIQAFCCCLQRRQQGSLSTILLSVFLLFVLNVFISGKFLGVAGKCDHQMA